jgi:hypothetical protein
MTAVKAGLLPITEAIQTIVDGSTLGNGYDILFFQAGTTTPMNAFPSYDDAIAETNGFTSVTADSSGRVAVWGSGTTAYKLLIRNTADSTVKTIDDVYIGGGGGNIVWSKTPSVLQIAFYENVSGSPIITNLQTENSLDFKIDADYAGITLSGATTFTHGDYVWTESVATGMVLTDGGNDVLTFGASQNVSFAQNAFFPDDKQVRFGNTISDPDAYIDWDSATGDLHIRVDNDPGGMWLDCVGTGDMTLETSSGDIILKPGAGAVAMTLDSGSIQCENPILIKEAASATFDVAAYGQFWVKTATPNYPMFTNDAGTDQTIIVSDGGTGGSGSAGSGNQYIEMEYQGAVYKILHDGTV